MAENFVTFSRVAWLVGVALLVMIANVIASILYMVVYSYLIDPGHDEQYYNDHIQTAAPYCSIVAGIPLMFIAGRWIARWWEGKFAIKSAIVVWLAYLLIDSTIILFAGALTPKFALILFVSFATKLGAVYFGASTAARSQTLQ
jgi:hypothetical protein